MSSAEVAAKIVKSLEPDDYDVLKILFSALNKRKSLTKDQIANYSKIHNDVTKHRIHRLHTMKLVFSEKNGVSLLMAGLDAIALKTLADRNVISGIGRPIGIGKESDVFEAITQNEEMRAIKFFRIGRISFRQVRRKRSFTKAENIQQWLLINTEAAEKEYNILQILNNKGIRIPRPYFRAMHSIVMNRIDGFRLVDIMLLEDPRRILNDILHDVKVAYHYGLINCDLSEYNIMVDNTNNAWIIDWPQSVSTSHPNANYLVRRDIYNIVNFFNRRFRLSVDWKEALKKVVRTFV